VTQSSAANNDGHILTKVGEAYTKRVRAGEGEPKERYITMNRWEIPVDFLSGLSGYEKGTSNQNMWFTARSDKSSTWAR